MSVVSVLPVRTCPGWCTDHTGFHDGSEDWHKSRDIEVEGITFYASTGTTTGQTEVFFPEFAVTDGMSLEETEAFACALLELIREVRA